MGMNSGNCIIPREPDDRPMLVLSAKPSSRTKTGRYFFTFPYWRKPVESGKRQPATLDLVAVRKLASLHHIIGNASSFSIACYRLIVSITACLEQRSFEHSTTRFDTTICYYYSD